MIRRELAAVALAMSQQHREVAQEWLLGFVAWGLRFQDLLRKLRSSHRPLGVSHPSGKFQGRRVFGGLRRRDEGSLTICPAQATVPLLDVVHVRFTKSGPTSKILVVLGCGATEYRTDICCLLWLRAPVCKGKVLRLC